MAHISYNQMKWYHVIVTGCAIILSFLSVIITDFYPTVVTFAYCFFLFLSIILYVYQIHVFKRSDRILFDELTAQNEGTAARIAISAGFLIFITIDTVSSIFFHNNMLIQDRIIFQIYLTITVIQDIVYLYLEKETQADAGIADEN